MTKLSPSEVAGKLGSGLLSFPVTHTNTDGSLDEAAYREHIGWLSQFAASGTATAVEFVRSTERDGASGVLLFPPYLTEADQDGLAAHVRASTVFGVAIYSRANAVDGLGPVDEGSSSLAMSVRPGRCRAVDAGRAPALAGGMWGLA